MRVLSKSALSEHWRKRGRADSEQALRSWFREASMADWAGPSEVRDQYRSASFVGDRVVFNIAGNKYRLVTWINYRYRIIYVRFVGTHAAYDRIDVETV